VQYGLTPVASRAWSYVAFTWCKKVVIWCKLAVTSRRGGAKQSDGSFTEWITYAVGDDPFEITTVVERGGEWGAGAGLGRGCNIGVSRVLQRINQFIKPVCPENANSSTWGNHTGTTIEQVVSCDCQCYHVVGYTMQSIIHQTTIVGNVTNGRGLFAAGCQTNEFSQLKVDSICLPMFPHCGPFSIGIT